MRKLPAALHTEMMTPAQITEFEAPYGNELFITACRKWQLPRERFPAQRGSIAMVISLWLGNGIEVGRTQPGRQYLKNW